MTGLVAGIGARRGASADDVVAALDAALDRYGRTRAALAALASSAGKSAEPALAGAAVRLGLPLQSVDAARLRAVEGRLLTRSARSAAATGSPSLSEAAALAAAGPAARLLGPRVALGPVTCALAEPFGDAAP